MMFGPNFLVAYGAGEGSGVKHRLFVELIKASNNSVGEHNMVSTKNIRGLSFNFLCSAYTEYNLFLMMSIP